MKIKRGSTSVRRLVFIADSSSTTGAGLANLAHDSAGLTGYYIAGDMSNEAVITFVTATLGTFTSEGFVAVDNTNMPGWYEIGIPNAALDGGTEVAIQIRGAANMVPVNIYIELDTVDYQTAAFGALQPTVAGRTLDVSAGGEAGLDWANIGSPNTTQNLSATTIKTASDVQSLMATSEQAVGISTTLSDVVNNVAFILADTDNIQTRLPAALVGGRMDSSVGSMVANVLTASALATDAVTEIQSGLATSASLDLSKAILDKLDTMLVLDGSVYQYTANALELGPGGSGSDPLDNAVPGSYAQGTAGYKLGLIGANASSVYSPGEVVTKTIYQTKTTTLTFTTSEDFTGYTATLSIKHRVTGATLLTKTITVTSSTLLTASLSATDTAFADLVDDDEFGPHPYEIRLVSGSIEKSLPRGIVFIYKDLS